MYSSVGAWNQWGEIGQQETPRKPMTTWQEARNKDCKIEKAFTETLPYAAWLDGAKVHHPEEVEDHTAPVREWVCAVCKRLNPLDCLECSVCETHKDYRNGRLAAAAKPRLIVPDDLIGVDMKE